MGIVKKVPRLKTNLGKRRKSLLVILCEIYSLYIYIYSEQNNHYFKSPIEENPQHLKGNQKIREIY